MKMSCLSVSLFPAVIRGELTIRQYADFCKHLGLDGFDLGMIQLKNHTPRYLREVRQDISDVGIPLVMVTTYPDFTHPDADQREREFDFLVHDMALASALGARFLRITAGQAHPGTDEAQGIDRVMAYFHRAIPVSERYGITLVYENHAKPGVWDYMDFSNPPHIFLEIARQLRGTAIGINFDTANILVAGEDTTLEVLAQVIDQVQSIHVAETATQGKMDPVPLGTGIVPMHEIFHYLKAQHFTGWLCLEENGNQGLQGVRDAVTFARTTWEKA